jgi:hypothetical protein
MSKFLELVKDKQLINLYSKHGEYQNATQKSNVKFQFDTDLLHNSGAVYTEIGILSAEIPHSFYTVNETNNILIVDYNAVVGSVITIPYGSYNVTQLGDKIVELLETATTFSNFIAITFDTVTGKMLIQHTDIVNVTTMTFKFAGSTIASIMGLGADFVISTTKTALTYPVNLLGVNQLVIRADNIHTANYNSGTAGNSNILGIIEVTAEPQGIILFRNTSNTYSHLNSVNLNNFTISIEDENDNFIDFNNQDWSITLALLHYWRLPEIPVVSFSQIVEKERLIGNYGQTIESDEDLLLS